MAAVQATHLTWANASSVKDPALNGRWFVLLPDQGGGSNEVAVQTVLAEHMGLEWFSNQPKPRPRAGTHDKFPDFAELPAITMTFYENEDFDVTHWLSQWRKEVWDTSGGDGDAATEGFYGLPLAGGPSGNGYRRNIVVYLFGKADETIKFQKTYAGCWPIGRGPIELSYAELDGRLTVSAQFSVTKLLANSDGGGGGSIS